MNMAFKFTVDTVIKQTFNKIKIIIDSHYNNIFTYIYFQL